jgi:hypothetical protein
MQRKRRFSVTACCVSLLLIAAVAGAVVAQNGVRVRGRITGIPTDGPAGWLRVSLAMPGVEIEQSARPDGTFEFLNVGPGRAAFAVSPGRITLNQTVVGDTDVDGIMLSATGTPQLFGQVTVEGGRRLPSSEDTMTGAVVRVEAREARGKTTQAQFMRSDGVFGFPALPAGDYSFRFPRLPKGYSVKSITHAGADVLKSPLKVAAGQPLSFLRITLTPDPQAQPVAGEATLVVSKRGRGKPYVEGALHYFEVRATDQRNFKAVRRLGGEWHLDFGHILAGASGSDSLAFSLPAGRYELRSYLRGCDGNCNRLGGPEDECRADFSVKAGESVFAERVQHPPSSRPEERTRAVAACAVHLSSVPPE